jgi:hypothetical protein
MSTDEQLIEQLRSLMRMAAADVEMPVGLLDGVAPRRIPRLWLPGAGALLAGLSTTVALAVAVLLVLLLGHSRSPLSRGAASPPTAATGPSSLADLRAELAILRRPQRPTDKIPAWGVRAEQRPNCSNCLNFPKLRPRDSRLLTTINLPKRAAANGRVERVYLVLGAVPRRWQTTRFLSGWHQRGRNARGLHLSLLGITTKNSFEAQPTDVLLNYSLQPMPAQALTPRDVLITSYETVGLVPDGVTRVRWELANPGQAAPKTVYPTVRGNVALAPWTPAPRSTALINEQSLVGATWYGPDGRVIANYSMTMRQLDRAHGAQ